MTCGCEIHHALVEGRFVHQINFCPMHKGAAGYDPAAVKALEVLFIVAAILWLGVLAFDLGWIWKG